MTFVSLSPLIFSLSLVSPSVPLLVGHRYPNTCVSLLPVSFAYLLCSLSLSPFTALVRFSLPVFTVAYVLITILTCVLVLLLSLARTVNLILPCVDRTRVEAPLTVNAQKKDARVIHRGQEKNVNKVGWWWGARVGTLNGFDRANEESGQIKFWVGSEWLRDEYSY